MPTRSAQDLLLTVLCVALAARPWVGASAWAEPKAAPVQVRAWVDKQRLTIGDEFTLHIQVTGPSGLRASLPEAEKRLLPFEVRDHSTREMPGQGQTTIVLDYKLALFEVGERQVSGLELQCQLPGQQGAARVQVPPVKVTVASVLPPDARDIKDIRDPVPIQPGAEQWLAAVVIALAILAALAALGLRLARRRERGSQAPSPVVSYVAAHERALSELTALERSPLLARGELGAFYVRLSEIIREYLEARYGVRAMEQTTRATDRDLRRRLVADDLRERFVHVLSRADLVKFARRPAAEEEARADLQEARAVVDDSRPALPVASSEGPAPAGVRQP